MIELRSDTFTKPTAAMKQAMMDAEVGDDVWGEDPTVNRLEAMVATMLGKEAAVFACSGTQSNQMGVRANCQSGDELLIHETGHIGVYEAGGPAVLSGVSVRQIPGPRGMLSVDALESRMRPASQHYCPTRLICLENTTNMAGGYVYSLQQMQEISEWARARGLRMHLDGARLFNAIIAGGYSAAQAAACFDTVSICFSKGLGCPMGSILVGSAEDMQRARRARKIFGGALRQSGMLAAAAIYALQNHMQRLRQDHENAQLLAQLLSEIEGISASPKETESNLVFFEVAPELGTAAQLATALKRKGVNVGPAGAQRIRAATHLDVTAEDVTIAVQTIKDCLSTGIQQQQLATAGIYDD